MAVLVGTVTRQTKLDRWVGVLVPLGTAISMGALPLGLLAWFGAWLVGISGIVILWVFGPIVVLGMTASVVGFVLMCVDIVLEEWRKED